MAPLILRRCHFILKRFPSRENRIRIKGNRLRLKGNRTLTLKEVPLELNETQGDQQKYREHCSKSHLKWFTGDSL